MMSLPNEKAEQYPKNNESILVLDKLCKRFGGVVAADEVSFSLSPARVHGLIGPNGSGKTTMLNLVSGITEMDAGAITLDGEVITSLPSYTRARKGLARTFQHPRLLKRCDIQTNLFLGIDLANMKKSNAGHSGEVLPELLSAAGLKIDMDDSITTLSYGQQKLFEIIRALLTQPKVLLLDEPAAGLNTKEMERVDALINIATKNNTAVLLVEHSMDLIMNICHTITVLNFGRKIAEGVPAEIQCNDSVIEAYLGRGRSAENC